MVHKLVNIYTKLLEPVTVQHVFLWASGAPNSRAAPGRAHSSYATDRNDSSPNDNSSNNNLSNRQFIETTVYRTIVCRNDSFR